MSIRRLSTGMRSTGSSLAILGLIAVIAPVIITPPSATHQEGAAMCAAIGAVLLLVGLPMTFLYYCWYEIAPGYALVSKNGRIEKEGKYFGLAPSSPKFIQTGRRVVEIPSNGLMELNTPDSGVLGVSVTVAYAPDLDNPVVLSNFQDIPALHKAIDNRIRGALSNWSMGKPLPGTLTRALSMQKEAEEYLIGKLSGTSTGLVLHDDPTLYFGGGYPIFDLAIRFYEINIVVWRPLQLGTNKSDWGDGDHTLLDAQSTFKQMLLHADNLSNLRKLKEILIERYKEEESDIEDIYDSIRISMKENRDR